MGGFPCPERGCSVKKQTEAGKINDTKTLQDLCREAKEEKRMTYANIAEKSGIVEKTVQNFFSSSSKLPPVYTAGPICRALGVSLDKYFDIVTDEQPAALELAQQENEHLVEQGRLKDDRIERGDQSNAQKNRIIIAMAGFILFLVAYMASVDLLNPMIGLFRGEFSLSGAVALLGFGVADVYICIMAVKDIRDRRDKK